MHLIVSRLSYFHLNIRQRQTSSPGLPTLIRLVLKVSPLNQDKEDLNDTIQSLVLNLALSEENETLEILNLVALFVKGYKDIFKKTDRKESNYIFLLINLYQCSCS